jgi:hypothetical protein
LSAPNWKQRACGHAQLDAAHRCDTLILAGIDAGNGRDAVMKYFERLNDIGRLKREACGSWFWRAAVLATLGDVLMFDEFSARLIQPCARFSLTWAPRCRDGMVEVSPRLRNMYVLCI